MRSKPTPSLIPGQPPGTLGRLIPDLVETLAPPLYRLIGASWRMHKHGWEHLQSSLQRGSFILCTWHGDMPVAIYTLRNLGLIPLISPHYEGELIARVVGPIGYQYIRGSSGHQPLSGLRGLIRTLRSGKPIALIPDGPEGPRRSINAVIIALASLANVPILPCLGIGRPHIQFGNWDRNDWPLPYAKVAFHVAPPLQVPANLDPDDYPIWEQRLIEIMDHLEQEAFRALGVKTFPTSSQPSVDTHA
ncbi:MAG: DUF374 domain-containing protein [bacterium]